MTLPSPDKIIAWLAKAGTAKSKRELFDAFDVTGPDVVPFKRLLRSLEDDGRLVRDSGKTFRVQDGLPAVMVIEAVKIDHDGHVLAKPTEWDDARGDPPRIDIIRDAKSALKPGDRALAKLTRAGNHYDAQILKRLDAPQSRVVGILRAAKHGFILAPVDRRAKHDFDVAKEDSMNAADGEIAVGEVQPSRSALRKSARVIEVVGRADDPKAISIMALTESGLRTAFPPDVLEQTEGMAVPPIKGRTDLRDIPLVTIDGLDARDFDDAVFAARDEKDPSKFNLIVAIADVSYYVRAGTPLDREAYLRGNSTYFPDRVLPMLPERLSNDLCSLRPHEDRACLAVRMTIDENGKLLRHQFVRGLMKSRARLTYEEVQAARNGQPDKTTAPLMQEVIEPLYEAFAILDSARRRRGALDLDLPERKIVVDEHGHMTGVKVRERLDSHKLIEEFMILANVAAAEALESKNAPCVYRIHDRPTGEKLDTARGFLEAFAMSLPKGGVVSPAQLNHLLAKAKDMQFGYLINEVILRAQAQAVYDPENIGHFGLALQRYAHFTSPIRRYADLVVHRSLVRAFDLGEGGLTKEDEVKIAETSAHISMTERASAEAERNAVDRFTAAFLADRIGTIYPGRISGVTRFGLFVKLAETGADGLVPIRSLPDDYYIHDESQHALIGRRTHRVFRLGASVMVQVKEADPLTASTVFELVNGEDGAEVPGYVGKGGPPRETFRPRDGKGGKRYGPKDKDGRPKKSGGKRGSKHRKGGKKP